MPTPSTVIKASRLTVCANSRELLTGVNATILAGSSTVLIGRTGSGKSAFLETALGLRPRQSGEIETLGLDPQDPKSAIRIRQQCGVVPQDKTLYGNFSVEEMCRFTRAFYPRWQDHLESRLLDRFNLRPHSKVRDLSPARRTLLTATLAMAHAPRILILDKPFDDLDPGSNHDLLQALVEAASEEGVALIVATNSPERMHTVADYAIFFRNGEAVASVSIESVTREWRLVTARFVRPTVLSSLPINGIEHSRVESQLAEWVVSQSSGARELATMLSALGAVSVQTEPMSLTTLVSRFV
ncbi:MAG: ABC transporter ATP-binding protein [Acidobacteria bacterium]|nr:ABC transporter ATP-binding protein [Acidobacteriota bacterium]